MLTLLRVTGSPGGAGVGGVAAIREASGRTAGQARSVPRSRGVGVLLLPGKPSKTVVMTLAGAVLAMMLASDFEFRIRSVTLALQGSVDLQVLVELAISAVVGGWLVLRRILVAAAVDRRPDAAVGHRARPGSILRLLRYFSLGVLASSLWSPTTIAPVRAVQFTIMVELVAEVAAVCRDRPELFAVFWTTLRRLLVAAVVAAVAVTFSLSSHYTPFTMHVPRRFRFLALQPIAAAHVFALTTILLVLPVISLWGSLSPDNRLRTFLRYNWARLAGALLAGLLLLLTRERAAMAATLVALAILILLVPNKRRVRAAFLVSACIATGAILLAGSYIYRTVVLRGQTVEEFTSFSGRSEIFSDAWRLFRAHPISGSGYVSGRSVFLERLPWAAESHNVIVEIAVSLGVIGLIAIAVLAWRWKRYLVRAFRGAASQIGCRYAAESAALASLALIFGVSTDSFAGPPGVETMVLLLGALLAEQAVVTSEAVSQMGATSLTEDRSAGRVVQLPALEGMGAMGKK